MTEREFFEGYLSNEEAIKHLKSKFKLKIEDEVFRVLGYQENHESDITWILPDIPDSLAEIYIEEAAFFDNGHIEIVKLDHKVKSIKRNAFRRCKNLQILESLSGLTFIGSGAFADCNELETIQFKDEKKENKTLKIDEFAFANCVNLRAIRFGKNVEIKPNTFDNCLNLEQVHYFESDFKEKYKDYFPSTTTFHHI